MQSPLPVDGPTNPKAKAIFARRILPGMVALLVAAIVAAASRSFISPARSTRTPCNRAVFSLARRCRHSTNG